MIRLKLHESRVTFHNDKSYGTGYNRRDGGRVHKVQQGLRMGCRVQMKCGVTRWRTGGEVKGKLVNGVGSQYPSHYFGTWCIQHYYR